MQIIDDVPVWGFPVDDGALRQIKNCYKEASHVALMADHHLGYSVPIGGVVAYEGRISPSGVGYDIACGNKAVRTDAIKSDFKDYSALMDTIWNHISFGVGRKNNEKVDHDLFDDPAWEINALAKLRDKAANQLGTIGSGNHYVDILADEHQNLWIGVHFGSRGFGHDAAKYYLETGGADERDLYADPLVLDVHSDIGAEYLQAMMLAGRYAYAGRDWVCAKVAQLMGVKIMESVHNHHNFAWLEQHDGKQYWVVRKGATPAFEGQKGFVGGSMGDRSVILEGKPSQDSFLNFNSTVHGAGRVMSRSKAIGKVNKKTGEIVRPGEVSEADMFNWLRREDVVLRGGGVDESPQVYKRLPQVLKYHSQSINILHTLTPLGVAMAGSNEFDPYKE